MSKLIMIDDSPMQHLVMQKMFERYELFHDVRHSTDGQEIIDFLTENRRNTDELPDLIFLDLNMPGFSGFEFLDQFEKLFFSFCKLICIYVISSSVDENDRRRASAYPFVYEFLIKPVKREKLEHIYNSYVKINRLAV